MSIRIPGGSRPDRLACGATLVLHCVFQGDLEVGTLTVRLSAEDDARLARLARQNGASKSEVVRGLVRSAPCGTARESTLSAYDLMKDGIGSWDSGGKNLSERTGDKFYEMLVEERKRRDFGRRRARPRRRA